MGDFHLIEHEIGEFPVLIVLFLLPIARARNVAVSNR